MKLKKLFGVLWVLIGLSLGGALAALILNALVRLYVIQGGSVPAGVFASCVLIGIAVGGAVGYFTMNRAYGRLESAMRWLQSRPLVDLTAGGAGLIAGLIVAFLLTQLVAMIRYEWLALLISVLVYIVLGYMGVTLGLNHREGWRAIIPTYFRARQQSDEEMEAPSVSPKVLDTSVLIDGRIERILDTGFLEGQLIIAAFVLTELQHLADSADELKRGRGRRGLEVVRQLQRQLGDRVMVSELDNERIGEVDNKLLWLTRQFRGKLVTNDYNLNKVAAVQNVPVLNINDLANAVKSAAVPGDRLMVRLMKEGKEADQGVGYLPDGTMVVVDNGQSRIGQQVEAVVTSSLQTSAGRMIFARAED